MNAPADDVPRVVKVRGLANRFGEQVVHQDLDLDVRQGEIIGVVGGSGTGKSVLMRAILGLRRPQAGSIEVLGVDALSTNTSERLKIERNSGVLYQNGALFSSLTVAENVMVPLKEHHSLPPDSCDGNLSAACASGPRWRGRWRWTRRCCSWTSPPQAWTRWARRPSTH